MIGHGPDEVPNNVYNLLIRGSIENIEQLNVAKKRFEKLGGRYLPRGVSLSHVAPLALDLLFEAEMAYCFNLRRSAIICCASALDSELRRYLVDRKYISNDELERKTFGGSIELLEKYAGTLKEREIENLKMVNNIRNKLAVHSAYIDVLVSTRDAYLRKDRGKTQVEELKTIVKLLVKYCSSEEIEQLQEQGEYFSHESTDLLALKVLGVTKTTILTLGK